MADPNIKMSILGNGESAERMIVSLEKKIDSLKNAQKNAAKESKAAAASSMADLGGIASSLKGVAAGYLALPAIIGRVSQANLEWMATAEKAARDQERFAKVLKIGTGTFGKPGDMLSKVVNLSATSAGTSFDDANALANALVEKGGFTGQQSAGMMKDILPGFMATRIAKGGALDPKEYADAIGDLITKPGGEITPASVKATTENIFGVLRGSELGVGDLDKMQETLINARAGKGGERHRKALQQMGLTFEDVDLEGEDLFGAMSKIGKGLSTVAPNLRSPLLQELTGDADTAKNMLSAIQAMEANRGQFGKAVTEATSGRAAGIQREENKKEMIDADQAGEFELLMKSADTMTREKGAYGWMNLLRRGTARALRGMSFDDNFAISAAFGPAGSPLAGVAEVPGGPAGFMDSVRSNAKNAAAPASEQTELLKEQNRLMEEQNRLLKEMVGGGKVPKRKPDGEP